MRPLTRPRHACAATTDRFFGHLALLAAVSLALAIGATPLAEARVESARSSTPRSQAPAAQPARVVPALAAGGRLAGPPALVGPASILPAAAPAGASAAALRALPDVRVAQPPAPSAEPVAARPEPIVQVEPVAQAPLPAPEQAASEMANAPQLDAAEPITAVEPASPPAMAARIIWSGTVQETGANLRAAPRRDAPLLRELPGGAPAPVVGWVQGDEVLEENPVWAELAEGGFVFSAALRRDPLPEENPIAEKTLSDGRWIDVDVTAQTLVAYEGSRPVRRFLVSTGRPGWETPHGEFTIWRRVEKETMDAATLIGAIPSGQENPTYKIEDVHYTQYFTEDGAAFHENTWRSPELFGMPGSHGCVSLRPADAAWLWEWADMGTPVRIHD